MMIKDNFSLDQLKPSMPGKPFSGKQKKEQLKAKRLEKREKLDARQHRDGGGDGSGSGGEEASAASEEEHVGVALKQRPSPLPVYEEPKATKKGKQQQQQQQRPGTGGSSRDQPQDGRSVTDSSHDGGSVLKYGGDKKGVRSVFAKEGDRTVEERKKLSFEPIRARDFRPGVQFGSWFELLSGSALQAGSTRFSSSFPFSVSLPTRVSSQANVPEDVRKEAEDVGRAAANPLEAEESVIFSHWLKRLDHMQLPPALAEMEINVFERNLDVWRQLWRTVELADVVIIVADARYPIMHLPLSLLHYVKRVNKKPFVIVLNKVDLVPESHIAAWKLFLTGYLKATGIVTSVADEVPILSFSCLPEAETVTATEHQRTDKRRQKKRRNMKLYEELHSGHLRRDDDDDDESEEASDKYDEEENFKGKSRAEAELGAGKRSHKELAIVAQMIDTLLQTCKSLLTANPATTKRQKKGREAGEPAGEASDLFVGIVGHPNVGKSSLINCIRGTKVVSVSATAGHTKHLQTIPIPSDGVTLVDCPGLAFPVFGVPRQLQAVIGTHQIAQTRDPQSSVGYLATRLPLEKIYGLRKIDGIESDPWSSFELCESYATKKGFMVKHGRGIADVHRAAIDILKEAYEGRLVLYFSPPPQDEYLGSKEFSNQVRPLLLLDAFPTTTTTQSSMPQAAARTN